MSRRTKREGVLGLGLSVGLLTLGLGGCGSTHEIDSSSIRGLGRAPAHSVAAVLPPRALGHLTPGGEDARRDLALGVQQPRARLALDAWPGEPRPSLGLQRQGRFTPLRGRTYLFYETPGEYSTRPRRRSW